MAAGSIGCYATKQDMSELLEYYKGFPCVLAAYELDGYVCVNFDNYQGIKDGLEFMIHRSECKHLAMIGANLENSDARERRDAFCKYI